MSLAAASRLWGLNGGVFVFSFLLSGLTNVIPQFILLALVPDQKAFWLPVSLLAATACAVLGTLLGGSWWERRLSGRWILVPLLGAVASFLGLFTAREPWHFVLLAALATGLGNLLVTRLDHLATRTATDSQRSFNDRLGTACRLLGMLLAPWFFTHQLQHGMAVTLALGLGAAGVLGAWLASWRSAAGAATVAPLAEASLPLDRRDYLLLGHAVSVFAALYLFAANLSYFLQDALAFDRATPRAGVLIVAVFMSALGSVAVASLAARRRTGAATDPGALAFLPALPLAVAWVAYEGRLAVTYTGMLAIASALGFGYGAFLLGLRDFVSRSAARGKTVLLTIYNNLANASALLAFACLFLLDGLAPGSGEGYYLAWMRLLAAVATAGIPAFLIARKRHGSDRLVPGESRA